MGYKPGYLCSGKTSGADRAMYSSPPVPDGNAPDTLNTPPQAGNRPSSAPNF